ncbi:heavy metal-associated isoprenylated plant protein 19-like [Forsythia ovata]|uniref:Heavy metal-associated isoprenylated plant protein 19-like n=1 Tax=Forsythia ovata TaxID=205694 RepID=A0ABD1UZG5_9LAMI
MRNHKVVVTGKINPQKVMKKVKKKTGKKMEIVDIDKEDVKKEGNLALEENEKQITKSLIFDSYCEDSEIYMMFSDENANACSIIRNEWNGPSIANIKDKQPRPIKLIVLSIIIALILIIVLSVCRGFSCDIGLKIYISSETKPKSVSPAHSSPPKLEVSKTTHHTYTPLALSHIQAPVVSTVKAKPINDNCAVASPESQNDKTSTQ